MEWTSIVSDAAPNLPSRTYPRIFPASRSLSSFVAIFKASGLTSAIAWNISLTSDILCK